MSACKEQAIRAQYFGVLCIVHSVANVQNASLGMTFSPLCGKMELAFCVDVIKSDHLVKAIPDSKLRQLSKQHFSLSGGKKHLHKSQLSRVIDRFKHSVYQCG